MKDIILDILCFLGLVALVGWGWACGIVLVLAGIGGLVRLSDAAGDKGRREARRDTRRNLHERWQAAKAEADRLHDIWWANMGDGTSLEAYHDARRAEDIAFRAWLEA